MRIIIQEDEDNYVVLHNDDFMDKSTGLVNLLVISVDDDKQEHVKSELIITAKELSIAVNAILEDSKS